MMIRGSNWFEKDRGKVNDTVFTPNKNKLNSDLINMISGRTWNKVFKKAFAFYICS